MTPVLASSHMIDMASLVERLRVIRFDDADEGGAIFQIPPPATGEQRFEAEMRLGFLPPDLDAFYRVTTRIPGSLDLDPDGRGLADASELGLGALFRVHEYGNGDGLYLEALEHRSALWWVGHDPWDVILVARSLDEYVERCVHYAEARRARELDPELEEEPPPYEPRSKASPVPATEAVRSSDPELRGAALAVGRDGFVFDLRGAQLPVHVDRYTLPLPPKTRLSYRFVRRDELVAAGPGT